MNMWKLPLLAALTAGAPGFAQGVAQEFAPVPSQLEAQLEAQLDFALQEPPPAPQAPEPPRAAQAARAAADAARRAATAPRAQVGRGITLLGASRGYDRGTQLLDSHKYEEAIIAFDTVIAAKGERADGALYWKAYAQNRSGKRDDAVATLATLRRDYPQSHWLNDAQVLEAEVKQNAGRPVSPADESNEDIKLMAINSLMRADPDRAVPLLEGLLKSGSSPRLKDRALFVLTQNRSPKAEQILMEYAKGAGNPDLQLRAIRYVGASGAPDSQQQLVNVYGATSDAAVKREILRALVSGGAKEAIFNLAKNEKDAGIRAEAVRQLGALKATDQLNRLYTGDAAPETKMEIIRAMGYGGGSVETLVSLYTSDANAGTRHELVNALFSRNDAKPLIDLARRETDPAMKKYIVERLSTMHNNKEATDYMMELLK